MVQWGHGRMERWRCPPCNRERRKQYHGKVAIVEDDTVPPTRLYPEGGRLYLDDADFKLYMGDCLEVLEALPDESVDCVVTSPPYWGLRDYGADRQLGLENSPEEYVANMVAVFREVRRVLATHGTCWVNLGDSYTSGGREWRAPDAKDASGNPRALDTRPDTPTGLKPKDLVGIPWRVAFALQADGWWLRSDVIWSKPNPMPESVSDRPTKSHEYMFLLTKAQQYWWDTEAVREPHSPDGRKVTTVQAGDGSHQHRDGERWPNSGRNIRTVWSIATQPYPDAHFATFPEELARRAIVAGCAVRVCRDCGKPSERFVERDLENVEGWAPVRKLDHSQGAAEQGNGRFGDPVTQTLGWSDCGHNNWRSGIVLDPFMGSGTVAKVARDQLRHAVGIELNPDYCALIARRLQQLSLLT